MDDYCIMNKTARWMLLHLLGALLVGPMLASAQESDGQPPAEEFVEDEGIGLSIGAGYQAWWITDMTQEPDGQATGIMAGPMASIGIDRWQLFASYTQGDFEGEGTSEFANGGEFDYKEDYERQDLDVGLRYVAGRFEDLNQGMVSVVFGYKQYTRDGLLEIDDARPEVIKDETDEQREAHLGAVGFGVQTPLGDAETTPFWLDGSANFLAGVASVERKREARLDPNSNSFWVRNNSKVLKDDVSEDSPAIGANAALGLRLNLPYVYVAGGGRVQMLTFQVPVTFNFAGETATETNLHVGGYAAAGVGITF